MPQIRMGSVIVLVGLLGLAGCDRQPGQTPTAGSPVTSQAPAPKPSNGPAPDQAANTPPQSSTQSCYLAVDGQVRVQGPCLVFPFGDGGYTLNAWSNGKPAQSHFAVVTTNGDGTATAAWNADPDDTRAGDPLGTVRFANGCWTNDRVRICAARL